MNPLQNVRSSICLLLVVILHTVFFIALKNKNTVKSKDTPLRQMNILFLQETPKILLSSTLKTRPQQSTLPMPPVILKPTQKVVPTVTPEPASPITITGARLDLDALRQSVIENERNRSRSGLERLQLEELSNRSLEAQLEKAAKKAQRQDCLTAHQGFGLFAPLLITADLIRDKGCKF